MKRLNKYAIFKSVFKIFNQERFLSPLIRNFIAKSHQALKPIE